MTDKDFPTRLSDSTVQRIAMLARRLRKSKRAVIEGAVDAYARRVDDGPARRTKKSRGTKSQTEFAARSDVVDVIERSCGAWRRRESPAQTVENIRRVFRQSMERRAR